MDLTKYQTLTGITVSSGSQTLVNALIKRMRFALEGMLGYTLNKSKVNINQYNEKGKTSNDCNCDIDGELQDPDEVVTAYRLFNYNKNDKYLHVDPFSKLNAVKLVHITPGASPNGVTVKTFDSADIRVHYQDGFAKYIEVCENCFCSCGCDDCMQLAVDADWLYDECLPEEILYIWCDMVDYYSDPKLGIKSETLGPHRYEFFSNLSPEEISSNIKIITKYAGPNGSVNRTITI